MQVRCWKFVWFASIVMAIVTSAITWTLSSHKYYRDGFACGFGDGWLCQIQQDHRYDFGKNCSLFWQIQYKNMQTYLKEAIKKLQYSLFPNNEWEDMEEDLAKQRLKDKKKRDKRRLAKEKKKKKAKKVYPWMGDKAVKLADHLANCSCEMCKSPRKSKFHKGDKKTMQERKFEDSVKGNWSDGF